MSFDLNYKSIQVKCGCLYYNNFLLCLICRCQTIDWTSFRRYLRLVGHEALVSGDHSGILFSIGSYFVNINEIFFRPFKVLSDGGKPKIQVDYKCETKTFTPEEVSSMVLVKMKETAEAYLGMKVIDGMLHQFINQMVETFKLM